MTFSWETENSVIVSRNEPAYFNGLANHIYRSNLIPPSQLKEITAWEPGGETAYGTSRPLSPDHSYRILDHYYSHPPAHNVFRAIGENGKIVHEWANDPYSYTDFLLLPGKQGWISFDNGSGRVEENVAFVHRFDGSVTIMACGFGEHEKVLGIAGAGHIITTSMVGDPIRWYDPKDLTIPIMQFKLALDNGEGVAHVQLSPDGRRLL